MQVVGRSEVAGVAVGPLLLERNPEQRRAADPRPHDAQEVAGPDAFLDVVGQVEVRVIEGGPGISGSRLRHRGLAGAEPGAGGHADQGHRDDRDHCHAGRVDRS